MRGEVVLALDLALTTGWAVFHSGKRYTSGAFTMKRRTVKKQKQPRAAAYMQLAQTLEDSLEGDGPIELACKPNVIVYEYAPGIAFKTPDAAESFGGFLAMTEIFAYTHGIKVIGVLNVFVKTYATGIGNADKAAMISAANKIWKIKLKLDDDDEADALHTGRVYLDGYQKEKWKLR